MLNLKKNNKASNLITVMALAGRQHFLGLECYIIQYGICTEPYSVFAYLKYQKEYKHLGTKAETLSEKFFFFRSL